VDVQATDALRVSARQTRDSRRAAQVACTIVGVTHAQISITWLADAEIAQMNREYLGHDGPTDVISFHLYDVAAGEVPIGDIYIGYEQAARQAASFGSTLDDELVRLAVHGTLHVLGFDHPDGDARMNSEMWGLQEAIVEEVLAQ
jgi:probable rRNA maturation factor